MRAQILMVLSMLFGSIQSLAGPICSKDFGQTKSNLSYLTRHVVCSQENPEVKKVCKSETLAQLVGGVSVGAALAARNSVRSNDRAKSGLGIHCQEGRGAQLWWQNLLQGQLAWAITEKASPCQLTIQNHQMAMNHIDNEIKNLEQKKQVILNALKEKQNHLLGVEPFQMPSRMVNSVHSELKMRLSTGGGLPGFARDKFAAQALLEELNKTSSLSPKLSAQIIDKYIKDELIDPEALKSFLLERDPNHIYFRPPLTPTAMEKQLADLMNPKISQNTGKNPEELIKIFARAPGPNSQEMAVVAKWALSQRKELESLDGALIELKGLRAELGISRSQQVIQSALAKYPMATRFLGIGEKGVANLFVSNQMMGRVTLRGLGAGLGIAAAVLAESASATPTACSQATETIQKYVSFDENCKVILNQGKAIEFLKLSQSEQEELIGAKFISGTSAGMICQNLQLFADSFAGYHQFRLRCEADGFKLISRSSPNNRFKKPLEVDVRERDSHLLVGVFEDANGKYRCRQSSFDMDGSIDRFDLHSHTKFAQSCNWDQMMVTYNSNQLKSAKEGSDLRLMENEAQGLYATALEAQKCCSDMGSSKICSAYETQRHPGSDNKSSGRK